MYVYACLLVCFFVTSSLDCTCLLPCLFLRVVGDPSSYNTCPSLRLLFTPKTRSVSSTALFASDNRVDLRLSTSPYILHGKESYKKRDDRSLTTMIRRKCIRVQYCPRQQDWCLRLCCFAPRNYVARVEWMRIKEIYIYALVIVQCQLITAKHNRSSDTELKNYNKDHSFSGSHLDCRIYGNFFK